jgi:arylsulfatase
MNNKKVFTAFLLLMTSVFLMGSAQAQSKPNVVLILMDNLGWGEPGCYGGGVLRGAPTPRLDKLASDGMRLLNYNVEAQCTPSRAALMTGRYAIRTGNGSVPINTPLYGLTQWEVTMPEMLSDAGYVTGMFGKWHLGHTRGRFPTDQGFDEWLGIPNSSDESFWPDNPLFDSTSDPYARAEYVMHGRKGEEPKRLRIYDTKERLLIDKSLTDGAIDFMKKQKAAGKPFFAFIPYTQPHQPTLPHPDFKGKSGNGPFADVLMQIDSYVGRLVDAVDEMGLRNNTVFIFTSDNGPEFTEAWFGSSGPWRGTYFMQTEASMRVPFIIRWPGKVPAGTVNNEIVHEMDLFPTLAKIAGGKLPADRVIDGVDQSNFLLGKQEKSDRESIIVYVGNDIFGVKWRNWKMLSKELDAANGEVKAYGVPRFYNLLIDPKEEHPAIPSYPENFWVRFPAGKVLTQHLETFTKEPAIKPGTTDPYAPKK